MMLSCEPACHTLQCVQVSRFKDLLQNGTDLTPIEVLWVERPQGNYYFAFGGLLKMISASRPCWHAILCLDWRRWPPPLGSAQESALCNHPCQADPYHP